MSRPAMPESQQRSLLVAIPIDLLAYTGYYLANVLFLLLSLPVALVCLPWPALKQRLFLRWAHGYARFLTQRYLPALGVCRVAVITGAEHCQSDRPFICVANHRGRLDALLLTGILRRTAVLIKARHARFPTLAHLVRHSGFVSVDPGSPESMAQALAKCRQLLQSGVNLLVFPEGARTVGPRLRRFGSLAFKAAIESGVPVVPAVIHTSSAFMARDAASFFPRKTVLYRLSFLPLAHPEAHETAAEFGDRVYRCMASEFQALDQGKAR